MLFVIVNSDLRLIVIGNTFKFNFLSYVKNIYELFILIGQNKTILEILIKHLKCCT